MRTFIDYLAEKHAEINPTILDDDMPDAFDDWMSDLDQDDLIKFADIYAGIKYHEGELKGMDRALQIITEVAK